MSKKIVLTYYCTGIKDIWHHTKDETKRPDVKDFATLRKSVADRGYDFVTIANELEPVSEDWKVVKMVGELERPEGMSLYVHKFIACYKYLLQHPEYRAAASPGQ